MLTHCTDIVKVLCIFRDVFLLLSEQAMVGKEFQRTDRPYKIGSFLSI